MSANAVVDTIADSRRDGFMWFSPAADHHLKVLLRVVIHIVDINLSNAFLRCRMGSAMVATGARIVG